MTSEEVLEYYSRFYNEIITKHELKTFIDVKSIVTKFEYHYVVWNDDLDRTRLRILNTDIQYERENRYS